MKDRYSDLCFLDTESGEALEESRVPTTPEALERRFGSERSLRIAIEAGTHSPWASRILEEGGHEVLVANARKIRLIFAWHALDPGVLYPLKHRGEGYQAHQHRIGALRRRPNPSEASILDLKQRTEPSNEKAGG